MATSRNTPFRKTQYVPGTFVVIPQSYLSYRDKFKQVGKNVFVDAGVAVVGAEMAGTPGIAARVFGALGEAHINVIAIAQGSSEVNISLVVLVGDADTAVRRIHAAFALDKLGENL